MSENHFDISDTSTEVFYRRIVDIVRLSRSSQTPLATNRNVSALLLPRVLSDDLADEVDERDPARNGGDEYNQKPSRGSANVFLHNVQDVLPLEAGREVILSPDGSFTVAEHHQATTAAIRRSIYLPSSSSVCTRLVKTELIHCYLQRHRSL